MSSLCTVRVVAPRVATPARRRRQAGGQAQGRAEARGAAARRRPPPPAAAARPRGLSHVAPHPLQAGASSVSPELRGVGLWYMKLSKAERVEEGQPQRRADKYSGERAHETHDLHETRESRASLCLGRPTNARGCAHARPRENPRIRPRRRASL